MRIADLLQEHPRIKEKLFSRLREVDVNEIAVYCGMSYPADECINCDVRIAMTTSNYLFKKELELKY